VEKLEVTIYKSIDLTNLKNLSNLVELGSKFIIYDSDKAYETLICFTLDSLDAIVEKRYKEVFDKFWGGVYGVVKWGNKLIK
jgi:hypothetical protein